MDHYNQESHVTDEIQPNQYYAVLDTKIDDDDLYVLIKTSLPTYTWVGENDGGELWDDSVIVIQKHTSEIIKLKSCQVDEETYDRAQNTVHNLSDDIKGIWIPYSRLLEDFDYLNICHADFKQSRKFVF